MSDKPYIPNDTLVGREIEKIFAGQEDEEGDVDVDGVIEALDRLLEAATESDVPELLAALKSPRNSFWTRELLSEPIAKMGGLSCLSELFVALHQNADEGHDNDHFHAVLINLVEQDPIASHAKLEKLRTSSDTRLAETAEWYGQFCD